MCVNDMDCKFFVVPFKICRRLWKSNLLDWTLLESQIKKGVSLKDTFVTQSWRLDSVKVDY